MNMCITSDLLKDAISNCDLRKRKFDFNELSRCHVLNAFKIFGQQMTNIKISTQNVPNNIDGTSKFDEILRLISTYCSVDTIKHLDIQYHKDSRIKKRFLYGVLPFFRQLESFAISETGGYGTENVCYYFSFSPKFNKSINEFVERVLMQAVCITSITLSCVKVTGRFLHLPLTNLETLKFVGCNVQDSLAIFSYLKTKPNLVQFTWVESSVRGIDNLHANSSDHIYKIVTSNILDLKTFEYNQNEMYISNSGKIKMHSLRSDSNVQLIGNFRKLEKLAIRTASFHPLISGELRTILEKRGTVKKVSFNPDLMYNSKYIGSLLTEYKDFN